MMAHDLLTSEDLIEAAEPVVPFTMSDAYATVSPVLPRMVSTLDPVESVQPTVRLASFRRGAEAPTSSSLAIFVCIGLVVGLFAFAVMTIAMPNRIPASSAKAAVKSTVVTTTPATTTAVVPPVHADVIKSAPQLITTADVAAEPSTASAKQPAARHRAVVSVKRPTGKTILPANPYKLP